MTDSHHYHGNPTELPMADEKLVMTDILSTPVMAKDQETGCEGACFIVVINKKQHVMFLHGDIPNQMVRELGGEFVGTVNTFGTNPETGTRDKLSGSTEGPYGRYEGDLTASIGPEDLPDGPSMPEKIVYVWRVYRLIGGSKLKSIIEISYIDPAEIRNGDYLETLSQQEIMRVMFPHPAAPQTADDDDSDTHDHSPHGACSATDHMVSGDTKRGTAYAPAHAVVSVEHYIETDDLKEEDDIRAALHNRLNDVRRKNEEAALKAQFDLDLPTDPQN